ncbi:homeobox-leucine zipper protein HOX24 [Sorghum bicolor]|uniref:Homeobox-leucine zipper protein n=1 Tax=Sorghum bicolor TaxID=4558 RepID=C5XS34_SORBI|nr:homeobox-leucine zipper protein HOX24 [Sorghum bicolor]EES05814.1 hypothetical protein SORBI_3004G300300 [Sorghum bicolor]|eukprot:XP_002452838.1 homeobox-leucine zipper protein HOX24 [Sorghum bicolor]
MERGDDCQFMVVHQYDEAAQLMHQLMVAAAGDQQDPNAGAAGRGAGGGGGERKRRFTEEQVRSLETTFHARRAKLEPREKAELARELGLQPRQVAIWFQNKRARWRSKQLEHDYAALRARYDALHARVDSLREEKLALAKQVDELRGRLQSVSERQDQSGSCEVNDAADDGKRNLNSTTTTCLVLVQEDDGATPPAAVDASGSEDSAATEYGYGYDYDHVVAYGEGLHDPLCATPDLWDTWPLLEWNAVA